VPVNSLRFQTTSRDSVSPAKKDAPAGRSLPVGSAVLCWVAGLLLLCLWIHPATASGEKAVVKDVTAQKTEKGEYRVGFTVDRCFTQQMEEAIESGIETTFSFNIRLSQPRRWWRDRKIASIQFNHTIQYDPIRKEYHVRLEESGTSLLLSNLEEAKTAMARVASVELHPSSLPAADQPVELGVKVALERVKLPFRFEALLFFVSSLWGFETDWHTYSLRP
jgi:hypothetical protein